MPKRKEKLDIMFYKKKCLHFCPSPTPLNWLRLVTPSSLRPKLIRKHLRPGPSPDLVRHTWESSLYCSRSFITLSLPYLSFITLSLPYLTCIYTKDQYCFSPLFNLLIYQDAPSTLFIWTYIYICTSIYSFLANDTPAGLNLLIAHTA